MSRHLLPTLSIGGWDDWEQAYDSACERHFFQSPRWGRIVAATRHLVPRILVFRFPTQQVLLPSFMERRLRGAFYGLRSMSPSEYGGMLSDKPLSPDAAQAIAERLNQEWRLHTLIISSSPTGGIAGWEKYQANTFTTHVLDLQGCYEAVWKHAFDAGQRNRIRKARRLGLEIRQDHSPKAVDSFYRLYLMSAKRLNYPPEPKILFEMLVRDMQDSVTLFLVSKDHEDIGGLIVAHSGQGSVVALFIASDDKHWDYCPNNLLFSAAIEAACKGGARQFDFLPSGKAPGIARYKTSFGACPVEVPEYWIKGRLPSLKARFLETSLHFKQVRKG